MTDPIALLQRGMPPTGKGIFLRDAWEPGPWHVAVVNAFRSDAAQLAQTASAAGCSIWLYGTPDRFTAATWRASLDTLRGKLTSIPHVVGVIIDREDVSPSLPDVTAMAQAMVALSSETRVGFTSYPSWGGLETLARTCGESVFGCVQIYGRSSQNPADWQSWFRRWQAFFGSRLIIATAGWASNPSLGTPEGFARYLDGLPRAPGALVWDESGSRMPPYIVDAYSRWEPGGGVLGTFALGALAELGRPPALIGIGIAAVVILSLAWVLAARRAG